MREIEEIFKFFQIFYAVIKCFREKRGDGSVMSKHLSQFQLRLVVLMFSKYFIVEKRNVKGEVGDFFFCEQKRCQWTYLKSFCLHSQFLVVSHFFYLDSRCLLECVKSTKNVVCWVRLKKEGNLIKKRQKLEFEPRTILIFDVSRSRVKWRFVFEIWHNFEIDMTATRMWKKSKNAKKRKKWNYLFIFHFFFFSESLLSQVSTFDFQISNKIGNQTFQLSNVFSDTQKVKCSTWEKSR